MLEVLRLRMLRSLAAIGVLVALAPRAGQAQEGRDFNNSWFWGAKGGMMTFWTTDVAHAPAPLIGIDWLITRQHAALYLSYDQSFFDETSSYVAYSEPQTGGVRAPVGVGHARIQNMQRFSAQAMAFPKRFGNLRPYAGVGFSLNNISKVNEVGTSPGGDAAFSIGEVKSGTSLILTGGAQWQVARFSVFGQASAMPTGTNFFFNDGTTFIVEGGIRYNIGSAIERAK